MRAFTLFWNTVACQAVERIICFLFNIFSSFIPGDLRCDCITAGYSELQVVIFSSGASWLLYNFLNRPLNKCVNPRLNWNQGASVIRATLAECITGSELPMQPRTEGCDSESIAERGSNKQCLFVFGFALSCSAHKWIPFAHLESFFLYLRLKFQSACQGEPHHVCPFCKSRSPSSLSLPPCTQTNINHSFSMKLQQRRG